MAARMNAAPMWEVVPAGIALAEPRLWFDPLALPSASADAIASSEPAETDEASPDPAATDPASPDAGSLGAAQDYAGDWTIVEPSEAGYRVTEQLANLPAESEAVGRTSDVSGSVTLVAAGDALQISAGSITVWLTSLLLKKSTSPPRRALARDVGSGITWNTIRS